jgi:iron complex outermembrane recepter protein
MTKTHALILAIFAALCSYSQNFIKGTVSDSLHKPVSYCAMALFNAKDSSQVKGNVSDSAGAYIFEKIKPGNYFIKFNTIGFKAAASPIFTLDSLSQITLDPQVLRENGVNLKEVSVAVYKPAIEFTKGMVVMNVENDILAKGNTVLELLKRVPGVIIDAQNNITINGVGGARFLIDDRLQQMPAPQVVDMLSNMNADLVSKIELIKNPPARYDAAGTGGVINIITKRAKVNGYNGNISFGFSKGKQFRFGPWGAFNYKSKKLSVFTNFSYGNWDGEQEQLLDRKLIRDGNTESIVSTGTAFSFQRVFWYGGGLEYDITPKTLLGIYVNSGHNDDAYTNKTETVINNGTAFGYDKIVYSVNDFYNQNSPNYNLSVLQKIDSTGGQIKLNFGYNNFLEKNTKTSENRFFDAGDVEVAPASVYHSVTDRDFKVYSQKLDLNKTFRNKLELEAGVKSSFVDNYSNNKLDYSNKSTGLFFGDTVFYNTYRYKERLLAAYTTLSRKWERFGLSIGLRGEETYLQAVNLRSDYKFSRYYWNVFPSGNVDLTLNKKNTIMLAYSYRIDRPHYGMLNPIRTFNEQLNYGVGNPELKPQYTHNINLDYNYNQFITASVGTNLTKDFTFWYTYTPDSSKVNIDTIFNFPQRDNYFFSLQAQKRIKWYSFQTYAVANYRELKGEIRGENMNSQTYFFYVNLNQEFYLPKDFKIQIWAGRGSAFRDGPQLYNPRSAIHISVHKAFLNKQLNISLAFHDVLYKDYQTYTSTFSDQSFYWSDKMDTRRIRITINYRFGKMRIEQRLNTEGDSRMKTGK